MLDNDIRQIGAVGHQRLGSHRLSDPGIGGHVASGIAVSQLAGSHSRSAAHRADAESGVISGENPVLRIVNTGQRVGCQFIDPSVGTIDSGQQRAVDIQFAVGDIQPAGHQLDLPQAVGGIVQIHQVAPGNVGAFEYLSRCIHGIPHFGGDAGGVAVFRRQRDLQVAVSSYRGGDAGDFRRRG